MYPADTKTSQRRRKKVLILVSNTSQISLKWKPRRHFFKTSTRRPPEDVLKISLKTSSRLFLPKAKAHLETIYGLSFYVRFKLQTYYHSITRRTNYISLNKLNTLKHGNNVEILKTFKFFSMKCQTRKYFFQELKSEHQSFVYSSVITTITPEV